MTGGPQCVGCGASLKSGRHAFSEEGDPVCDGCFEAARVRKVPDLPEPQPIVIKGVDGGEEGKGFFKFRSLFVECEIPEAYSVVWPPACSCCLGEPDGTHVVLGTQKTMLAERDVVFEVPKCRAPDMPIEVRWGDRGYLSPQAGA